MLRGQSSFRQTSGAAGGRQTAAQQRAHEAIATAARLAGNGSGLLCCRTSGIWPWFFGAIAPLEILFAESEGDVFVVGHRRFLLVVPFSRATAARTSRRGARGPIHPAARRRDRGVNRPRC